MHKIKYSKTFLLGFGFFAISILWSVYNAFMPKILSNFISSATIIGFIMTIDNYFAMFIQPSVGIMSDKINTRYGKRMPFIMVGMPISIILVILLANYSSFIMLITCLVLMNLSMSIYRSPVIALMPDITYKENRSKANSIINFMGGIGAVIAYYAGSKLWNINQKYPFYLAALLMLISFIVLLKYINEKRDVIEYEKNENRGSFIRNFISVGKNKNTVFLLAAICTWFIAFSGIEALFTLYGINFLKVQTSAATTSFLFISVSFLIFAIPAGIIGTKIGKKKTITIGLVGLIASFAVIVFLRNLTVIRALFLLCGLFWAFININSYPYVTDMAPKGQTGTYTGFYYFSSSVAAIISPPLLGAVIDLIGYKYMFVYGMVFFLISLLLFINIKSTGDNKLNENMEQNIT